MAKEAICKPEICLEKKKKLQHVSLSEQMSNTQWRSDDFQAPPQTTCLGPWPRVYGDYFFLAGPFNPAGPAGPSLRHWQHCISVIVWKYSSQCYINTVQ